MKTPVQFSLMKNKIEKIILGITFLLYVIGNGYLVSRHEPWRDEALAWLIARDLGPLGVIHQMSVEGHPCLWHFLLYPFAHAGLPVLSMNIISLIIMSIAVAIFLAKAPFRVWLKILLVASPLFSYEYPVIARSYCLGVLFIMCLATLEKKRFERPYLYAAFLALLVQTHIILIGLAFFLSLVFLVELVKQNASKGAPVLVKKLLPLLLPAASAGFLYLILRKLPENSTSLQVDYSSVSDLLYRIYENIPYSMSLYMKIEGIPAILLAIAVVAVVLFLTIRYRLFGKGIVYFGAMAVLIGIFVLINGPTTQRAMMWSYCLLWFFWVVWDEAKGREEFAKRSYRLPLTLSISVLTVITCVLMSIRLYPDIIFDAQKGFSDGKNVAMAVEAVVPENGTVVMPDAAKATSVAQYLTHRGIRIYCPQQKAYITYTNWDENWSRSMTMAEVTDILNEEGIAQNSGDYYIIIDSSSVISDLDVSGWTLLYKTAEPTLYHEDFELYYVP